MGANLVRRLISAGYAIRVLDNLGTGDRAHLAGLPVELVEGDIRDAAAVRSACQDVDLLVHLAAAGSVVMSVDDPVANFETNAVGTFQVLNAARQSAVGRMVLASTGGALIGAADPPVDERSLPKPISPYGASKLSGEGYAHAFAKSYGLPTVALRFANVYGPWSGKKQGAITKFFQAVHTGKPMVIYGDGTSTRDYLHVSDICRAIEAALTADVPGGSVFHISSGVETTVMQLANLCATVAGSPGHPLEVHPKRAGEVERNFASFDLAEKELGYAPTVALEDGLAETWQWYLDHVF